jgi:hypothetical protein
MKNITAKYLTKNISIYILSVCTERTHMPRKFLSVSLSSVLCGGGGVSEVLLLLSMLRTSIHARGISNITIGQMRNVCYCQLELGVVGRWNNRLPLAVAGTTVPVPGVRLIPYWPQEEHV